MSSSPCAHIWVKQPEYSDWSAQRFKCANCSHWGHKPFKRVIEYRAGGVPTLEPRPEWRRASEPSTVSWVGVGGTNPDRNTPDDDSTDYKGPRNY